METYGSYQLLKRLATGGMAQIFLARQSGPEGFEKLLVLKRILPHLAESPEFTRMFLDEARIAARLNHSNIVQIFNLGAQDDSYFIAMEYIHGEDVRRVWRRSEEQKKEIPVALVCRIIMESAAALDYAHKKTDAEGKNLGIVHRDISPQNILVTFEGGVKLVDFGIAKVADQATHTRSGVLKGKYAYMSPEQATGMPVDGRTDIFALGIVFYELLTGTRLFKRGSDLRTLNAVVECDVMPPSQVNSRCPEDLDPVVMRALAKRPEDRYQDALALHLGLEEWLLQNQLPSSSAQVAAFMHEIYAERLAQEAKVGGPILEEGDLEPEGEDAPKPKRKPKGARSSGPSERRKSHGELPPAPPQSAAGGSPRRSGGRTAPSGERAASLSEEMLEAAREAVTLTDDEPKAQPAAPATRFTHHLERKPGKRRSGLALVCLGLLVALGAAGSTAWRVFWSGAPAMVHLVSDPPGATVVFGGGALADPTPCTLPRVSAGSYPIVVGKTGYLDYRGAIIIPEKGEVTWPLIRLEREPPRTAPAPPPAPAPMRVYLTVRSEPSGANVFVSGVLKGTTPLTVEAASGAALSLRVERAGYEPAERVVGIGAHSEQTETLVLERAARQSARSPRGGDGERDRQRGMGNVHFMVTPWADVACGSYRFGPTHLADKQLPVGVYLCVFSNPDHGTRTERVEIKPNELAKVMVNF